ncbi:TetR family transcriptional regulator C-terminal domain-containing protein [Streptomyces sp. NBC_00009]|uniref:TetR family transcriptional regulator C-terminal domain-containing protein n=1 Tax=Streptomyces sp. NBC_00009 TaxID=2975620 RepID=UPI003255E014
MVDTRNAVLACHTPPTAPARRWRQRPGAAASIGDRGALSALRQLCLEVMPLDDTRRQEASVVIAFADRTQYDVRMAARYRTAVGQWREQMRMYVRQARVAGEITTGRPDALVVDTLLAMVVGFQTANCLTAR